MRNGLGEAQRLLGERPVPTRHRPEVASPSMLIRSIEIDIIPRLVLAVRTGGATLPTGSDKAVLRPTEADVSDVTAIIVDGDAEAGVEYVEALRQRGMPTDVLFLDLLAPVARRLGALWEEDLCDFTLVTIGLMRLQQILRRLSPDFLAEAAHLELGCRVLLAPAPGEQHTFGLNMVGEFFRRAGWEVHGGAQATARELTDMVRGTWFAVVGFSLGSETRFDLLRTAISRIRRASCNPAIGIMVGGPLLLDHPELVRKLGADATASDAQGAVLQAHRLLALLPDRARSGPGSALADNRSTTLLKTHDPT